MHTADVRKIRKNSEFTFHQRSNAAHVNHPLIGEAEFITYNLTRLL